MECLARIDELIRMADDYRKSVVVEMTRVNDTVVCLIDGAENKLKISCESKNQKGECCCTYCTEAIPLKKLGEIEGWIIVGNKFASTDFEVSAVSDRKSVV